MILCKWEKLPEKLKNDAVLPYYKSLRKKWLPLFFKRLFDVVASFIALILLSPLFLIIALAIKCGDKGPVFYRQVRITTYGKEFRIHKFRSMRVGADKQGEITTDHDNRITKVSKFMRKLKIDEVAQMFDIFTGNMSFVGTRPEVPRYVDQYTDEMFATLLMPAGLTSLASLKFKDEAALISDTDNADEVYLTKILPEKMKWNLLSIKKFGFWRDIVVIIKTAFGIFKK